MASHELHDKFEALASQQGGHRGEVPDRWELYARLREEAPVFGFRDWMLISRFSDVGDVLKDNDCFQSGPLAGGATSLPEGLSASERAKAEEILGFQSRWITSANGERHRKLRTLVTSVLTPHAVEQMRQRLHSLTDEMLAALEGDEPVDFIAAFAYRLPLTVICELLDIDEAHRERIHTLWVGIAPSLGTEWRFRLPAGLDSVYANYVELAELLGSIIESRRGLAGQLPGDPRLPQRRPARPSTPPRQTPARDISACASTASTRSRRA
jgi:cytochrome P450